jgi:hypothetical protein
MPDTGFPSPANATEPGFLNDPGMFVQQARRNGFSPAQAAALYHQKRVFQAGRWLHPDLWSHRAPGLLRFVQDMATHLAALRTPSEWLAYAQHLRERLTHHDVIWGSSDMERLLGFEEREYKEARTTYRALEEAMAHPVLADQERMFPDGWEEVWKDHGETEETWPTLAVSGTSRAWSDEAPRVQEEAHQPWTWAKVQAFLDKDRLFWPKLPPQPRRWTWKHAQQWLHRMGMDQQLVQWEWPWVEGANAETGWKLVQTLRLFRRAVRVRVGDRWKGSLLGLKGRVIFRLGGTAVNSGLSVPSGENEIFHSILISSHIFPLHALAAHEWAHALDSVLHRTKHGYGYPWALSQRTDALDDWGWDLHAMAAFRKQKGQEDWNWWRARAPEHLRQWLAFLGLPPVERPWWHAQLQIWMAADRPLPSLLEISQAMTVWEKGPHVGPVAVYRWLWLYHRAPAAGQSLWDHANASMQAVVQAYDEEAIGARAPVLRGRPWDRDELVGWIDWHEDVMETWARWFEGGGSEGNGMDTLAFTVNDAPQEWARQHQAFMQKQAPLWWDLASQVPPTLLPVPAATVSAPCPSDNH